MQQKVDTWQDFVFSCLAKLSCRELGVKGPKLGFTKMEPHGNKL